MKFDRRLPRTTNPPVSQPHLSAHLREYPGESAYELEQMAQSAAYEIEDLAQVALITQWIDVETDGPHLPGSPICLPIGPVLSTAAVTVQFEEPGQSPVALAPSQYQLRGGMRPSLRLIDDGQLPMALQAGSTILLIAYEAGFGPDAATVPADLQHAILDQAASAYDQRGVAQRGDGTWLSPHAARIIGKYRGVRA
ncbi:head-tail connector protein [Fluviibacterium sp. S390]|uniref:head-tail connector protein n=1 Tax=Fluviibacterium sp. S390 TaxID=3415139 RepID=UPI003C7D7305